MILVLNCGSQTIKWKLFEQKGLKSKKQGKLLVKPGQDYQRVLEKELKSLAFFSDKIAFVGHRVVHGGPGKDKPLELSKKTIAHLRRYEDLAPLHQPFNLLGVELASAIFKAAKHFIFFDTSFFCHLPLEAKTYALPQSLSKKHCLQRFGFHGISHEYVGEQAAKILKKPFKALKLITCHLGGGSSITAIKKGAAIDTSMGFTPLEGLVMMTRSGDIDPGILIYLEQKAGYNASSLDKLLNKEGGLKGLCGHGEMLELLQAIKDQDQNAQEALAVYVYRIKKYLSAYWGILGGADGVVFTGAIGFGSAKIRKMICNKLKFLKSVKIMAIETNEELAIAKKIKNLI